MPTIVFSTSIISSIISGTGNDAIVGTSSATQLPMIFGPDSLAGQTALAIYKGTVPTDFSGLSDLSTRASDLLVVFTNSAGSSSVTDLSFVNPGLITSTRRFQVAKQYNSVAATGTGTATWFVAYKAGSTDMTTRGAMLGTVSITGGGGDIQIPDPNIIATQNYQSAGFYINFPQSWTV